MSAWGLANNAGSQQPPAVPPFAPTPPPPSVDSNFPPPPQLRQPSPPRRMLTRSRSRSPDRSSAIESQQSQSGGEDEEEPPFHWRELVEDQSVPCDDEMKYILTKEEHSALEIKHWENLTFFPLDDPAFYATDAGRVDWLVESFNGTKDLPNKHYLMRSPIVRVGDYDWRLKLYPRGNGSGAVSVYLECVTMQKADFEEFEPFDVLPFPTLQGYSSDAMKKRRSIAVQLSLIVYNPAEPRTHMFKKDAYRFSKRSPDYGYRYFFYPEEMCARSHGQRQPLLRNDKLAFSAYIRIVNDPTGCLWLSDSRDSFEESIHSTGLRPFCGQSPVMAAYLPLLHFEPFRKLIMQQAEPSKLIYDIQTVLYKMLTRTRSGGYGRFAKYGLSDAITCLRRLTDMLCTQLGHEDMQRNCSLMSYETGAFFFNRLRTKCTGSVQEAVNNHATISASAVLTLELQRQEWVADQRKWIKLTNTVKVEEALSVGSERYTLYAAITHSGHLQSNIHNVYVRPDLRADRWYAYKDGVVTAMTFKQAVSAHEGAQRQDAGHLRASSLSNGRIRYDDEVIYAVMYVRDDCRRYTYDTIMEQTVWEVPEAIRKGKPYQRFKDGKTPPKEFLDHNSDLAFRAEQDQDEQEEREREERYIRSVTPIYMPKDGDGDVHLSDVDDMPPEEPNPMLVTTVPSASHKWQAYQDCLGCDYYQGEVFGDKFQGKGWLVTMSGNSYTGDFYQGKKEGQGTMVYASGDVYEGEWKDDVQHGHGKLTYAVSGSIYVGEWQEGRKHGKFHLEGTVTEDDKSLCTICYERDVTTAFYDCGHVLACKECAHQIDNCPICRRRVLARLQIYGVKMSLE
ncbi:hypothetical protein BAUCODRAFT_69299 [Baudoinia panamericana UAMH 10762]|uniref:RING-type domain-containing protein n=1 Tax=Baudoinia panamericana (strain UAMH 10762) TaxID=717646 RepID=M2MZU4_BAUPA|nr:uncharacterized protein BAUCODRAFT_69299 [Baudoinia panamericana UAMH 10762]EMC97153.1 hypothetical protein BAUCODRAFT_69299 [Baudoinia panamericana UAMH 10762]